MNKYLKCYIEEMKDVIKYEKMYREENDPQRKQMYKLMHDDEKKHANMIMDAFPMIKEEIHSMKEIIEKIDL